jgi:transposase
MPRTTTVHAVTTVGIDMGKNTLHMIGLDSRGAIVLREKVARGRITSRLANLPSCLIGIEAGMATHYVARELAALGHEVKQAPPAYSKPFRQGHKNDFRDAHAVAEAVQRPTTRFVPAKTNEQLDLQALHRVRSRLVSERTAVINQIRGFLLERGIIVRQGLRFLRQTLPDILAKRTDVLSPRMVRIVADLASDWRQLDERIEIVTDEIETLAKSDNSCRRVMTVPGALARSSRVRWLQRLAVARHSQEAGIFRPGSASSPSSLTIFCAEDLHGAYQACADCGNSY